LRRLQKLVSHAIEAEGTPRWNRMISAGLLVLGVDVVRWTGACSRQLLVNAGSEQYTRTITAPERRRTDGQSTASLLPAYCQLSRPSTGIPAGLVILRGGTKDTPDSGSPPCPCYTLQFSELLLQFERDQRRFECNSLSYTSLQVTKRTMETNYFACKRTDAMNYLAYLGTSKSCYSAMLNTRYVASHDALLPRLTDQCLM
jgi:hypothetical protein